MLCTAVYYLHQIDEGLFLYFFFRLLRRYTSFTLFPYTTLFRSQIFHKELSIPQTLKQSMEYSLRAGGKRIRPMLLLAATEALQGPIEEAVPIASALELIHTYSLIHDDLPAMDDDDFRRGKPTNHKVYGEAMAILAGDGLLTHAFFMIASRSGGSIPAERLLRIVEELSWFAGPRGMVGGQASDIEGEQGITNLQQLESIH